MFKAYNRKLQQQSSPQGASSRNHSFKHVTCRMYCKLQEIFERTCYADANYNYYIESFSNNEVIYKIVYNGTPNKFLEEFNTENIKVHLNNNVWKINEN